MDAIDFKKYLPHSKDAPPHNPREEMFVPPWIFKHRDLSEKLESARKVDLHRLINIINHIHFTEGNLFIHFSHNEYENGILVKSSPNPCLNNELSCRWVDNNPYELNLDKFTFQQVIIADGTSIILIPGRLKRIDPVECVIELPEISYDVCQRRAKRYECRDVTAEIIQNGILAKGILIDFNPLAFRVRICFGASNALIWFNAEAPTTALLRHGDEILFSGLCTCVRQMDGMRGRDIVLSPSNENIIRYQKTKIRNPRLHLNPPPTIVFDHPLFARKIKREIHDMSNVGMSVFEKRGDGVLMPGMIIPELTIKYSGALEMSCKAQVIYAHEHEEDKVRCGLVILDMDIKSFSQLTQLLNHTSDHYNYISNKVDMDALWEFFFDTGFIYPKKYNLIQSYRNDFKETYRKLYQDTPDIARHFTYEREGKIFGHMSMVRAYEKTWLIQHHAARPLENKLPGLQVLKQIMIFLHGMYQMPSAMMDYVMCYYRPVNKFPNRTFGGFAQSLNNSQGCSQDLFCYLSYQQESLEEAIPQHWTLEESSQMDLWELQNFYQYSSAGLLMSVLGLGYNHNDNESLEKVSERHGFLRKWNIFSLAHKNKLKAAFIVNQSDLGVNLSELLNSIMIIIVDSDNLSWDVIKASLSKMAGLYNISSIPLLIYPQCYVEDNKIPYDKEYQLWILNMRFSNQLMEFMQRRFRMKYE